MAKFKTRIWWYELHGGEVEIEANSLQEAEDYAEMNEHTLMQEARSKGDTYSESVVLFIYISKSSNIPSIESAPIETSFFINLYNFIFDIIVFSGSRTFVKNSKS